MTKQLKEQEKNILLALHRLYPASKVVYTLAPAQTQQKTPPTKTQ